MAAVFEVEAPGGEVAELMALCDRLEQQIGTAQAESRRLLEAVPHRALNGAETAA